MWGFKVVLLLAGAVCQIAAAPQLVSAALAASGLGGLTGLASLATDTHTMGKAVNLASDATRYATYMVKNASEAGTTVARVGLNQTTALGGKLLSGGVDVGKQSVDVMLSASKHFAGAGQVMGVVAPVANFGLNAVDKVGSFGLNLAASKGDKMLDVGNRIVQHKAELVNTGAQKVIGVGRTVVNTMDSVKNSVSGGLTSKFSNKLSSLLKG